MTHIVMAKSKACESRHYRRTSLIAYQWPAVQTVKSTHSNHPSVQIYIPVVVYRCFMRRDFLGEEKKRSILGDLLQLLPNLCLCLRGLVHWCPGCRVVFDQLWQIFAVFKVSQNFGMRCEHLPPRVWRIPSCFSEQSLQSDDGNDERWWAKIPTINAQFTQVCG